MKYNCREAQSVYGRRLDAHYITLRIRSVLVRVTFCCALLWQSEIIPAHPGTDTDAPILGVQCPAGVRTVRIGQIFAAAVSHRLVSLSLGKCAVPFCASALVRIVLSLENGAVPFVNLVRALSRV